MKLSTTQAFPWLSNISLPPPLKPPPENFSGRTQALGAKLRYGMKGVDRIVVFGSATG